MHREGRERRIDRFHLGGQAAQSSAGSTTHEAGLAAALVRSATRRPNRRSAPAEVRAAYASGEDAAHLHPGPWEQRSGYAPGKRKRDEREREGRSVVAQAWHVWRTEDGAVRACRELGRLRECACGRPRALAGMHARAGERLCGHYMHDVLGCMHVGSTCNSPHAHTKTVPAFSFPFLFTPFI
jgi:hypothetical protein